jgi:hypothetical protein
MLKLSSLRGIDWTFLFACIAWGLTTALMLYVKLRKKTESFPVLILVGIFLLYMNAGDLFNSFRIYTVACVNRRILAHQFLCALVFGFLSNSYSNFFVLLLLTGSLVTRPGFAALGKCGIPFVGSFLVHPFRKTLVALGLASQCFGFFTGTVLSIAMLDPNYRNIQMSISPPTVDPNYVKPLIAITAVILGTNLIKLTPAWRGRIHTVLGSALLATTSRLVNIYNGEAPLLLVPVIAIVGKIAPGAVTSIVEFIPVLVKGSESKLVKVRIFITVSALHALGALLANLYLSPSLYECPEYVSRRTIAQEMFFSTVMGFMVTARPASSPIVYLSAFIATAGSDIVHLSSSISFGAEALGNGRLLARIIWQTIGALVGACLVGPLADSEKIDFDPITSVTRTTDGQVIRNNARVNGQ